MVADRIGRWTRAACGWHEAQHLRVARFGDNMRDVAVTEGDKVEAQIRFGVSVNGYGVSDLVVGVACRRRRGGRRRWSPRTSSDYELAPELAAGGERHDVAALRRPDRGRPCALPRRAAAFGAFTDTFEDLGGLRQLPGLAVQRLMADGYGFGGEGDWKTAILVRLVKVMARGLPGGTSFMEDYTYHLGAGRRRRSSARTCSRSARRSPAAGRRCEIHPLSIGGREDPVRLVFDAAPGPGRRASADRPRRPLPARRQRDRRRRARRSRCRSCPSPARCGGRGPTSATATEAWLTAGGPHHTVLSQALEPETCADFAEMAGVELLLIDEDTTGSATSATSCAGTRPTTTSAGDLRPRRDGSPRTFGAPDWGRSRDSGAVRVARSM